MKTSQLLMASGYGSGLNPLRLFAWVVVGAPCMLGIGSYAAWHTVAFWKHPYAWPWFFSLLAAFFIAAAISARLRWLPLAEGMGVILLNTVLAFLGVLVVAALARTYYSRPFLAASFLFSAVWLMVAYHFSARGQQLSFAVVPGGMADELSKSLKESCQVLSRPELPGPCQGIVVDWHQKLDDSWVRLLSECSLKRIPVYHAAIVYEAATGKVSLPHLSKGLLENLRPAPYHRTLKRAMDLFLVLFFLPVAAPLGLLVALAVKLDSPGPVLFRQERAGQGGRVFQMYKFRSMYSDAERAGARFAASGDQRVTRLGRFIRRYRLDELPQFLNVLLGNMSLVGPRPEQLDFVKMFERDIPFYNYRHQVRPGITGWAQVNFGYTADADETRHKLEYDLYYIKHLTVWLDILVIFKTFRILLTGYGAR